MLNSIRLSTSVSISHDSIDTLSPFPELPNTSLTTGTLSTKTTNSHALLPSSEPSPTMLDFSTSQKDLKLLALSSLKLPERELKLPRENATLLISLPSLHPLERVFFCLEVLETEKLRGILVYTLVRRVPTLLLTSEPRAVNSRELEAEDDPILFKIARILVLNQHKYH